MELLGLEMLHKKYGDLTWKEVVEPVIPLARDGFEANPELVITMQMNFTRDNITTVHFSITVI